MKYAHYIEMRVFCREEEDEPAIEKKIRELFPFDFDKENIIFSSKTAIGFEDKKIKILTAAAKKERHTTAVLKNLMSRLGEEQISLLHSQIASRLDSSLHFYIRLDKDKLMQDEFLITDSGNCFHFTIAVAAYPHSMHAATEVVKSMLKLK